jgi:hypothetical protein
LTDDRFLANRSAIGEKIIIAPSGTASLARDLREPHVVKNRERYSAAPSAKLQSDTLIGGQLTRSFATSNDETTDHRAPCGVMTAISPRAK